jgi:hypothetical protein
MISIKSSLLEGRRWGRNRALKVLFGGEVGLWVIGVCGETVRIGYIWYSSI